MTPASYCRRRLLRDPGHVPGSRSTDIALRYAGSAITLTQFSRHPGTRPLSCTSLLFTLSRNVPLSCRLAGAAALSNVPFTTYWLAAADAANVVPDNVPVSVTGSAVRR